VLVSVLDQERDGVVSHGTSSVPGFGAS
jgi:hypothetical protein